MFVFIQFMFLSDFDSFFWCHGVEEEQLQELETNYEGRPNVCSCLSTRTSISFLTYIHECHSHTETEREPRSERQRVRGTRNLSHSIIITIIHCFVYYMLDLLGY